MKQRFLLSILFVCSFMATTRAQIGKGSVWLGGSIGYSQSKDKAETSTVSNKQQSFNISPALGKAVKDNLIIGISANYMRYTNKTGSTTERKDKTYGGGIFIRKYIPVIDRLYIFGEAEAFYSAYRSEVKNIPANGGDLITKGWNGGINATPGLSYAVSKNIQIETGVNSLFQTGYIKRNAKNNYGETENSSFSTGIYLDNASQIFIGFRFLLNKKA